MYAPIGHMKWTDLFGYCEEIAGTIIAAHTLELSDVDPVRAYTDELKDSFVHAPQAELTIYIVKTWLVANICTIFPPSLTTSSGRLMQSDWPIFLHADRLDWVCLSWPINEMAEFHGYFLNSNTHGVPKDAICERFVAIDPWTGIVTEKNPTRKWLESASHVWEPDIEQWLALIREYKGWAVCWSEDQIPDDQEEIFRAIGLEKEAGWLSEGLRRMGETSSDLKQSGTRHVADCLLQAFPDGKGGATWSEVEAKVGYSRRHILRAISDSPRLSAWVGKP